MTFSRGNVSAVLKAVGVILGGAAVWFGVAAGLIFLAGGMTSRGVFDVFYAFWPVLSIALVMTGTADAVFLRKGFAFSLPGTKVVVAIGPISSIILFLYFLPIIMNGLSKISELIGWESLAAFLFAVRWDAPIVIVLGAWSLIALIGLALFAFESGRGWIKEKLSWLREKLPNGHLFLSI